MSNENLANSVYKFECISRLKSITSPTGIKIGGKALKTLDIDTDYLKLLYFMKSINFSKEECELLLSTEGKDLRAEIVNNMQLGYLMIKALG